MLESTTVSDRKSPLFNPPALRKDVEVFKVQEHVYFQVYWKVIGSGKGPATILYLFDIETLKFDIYGKDKGHYHANPNNPHAGDVDILWLPELDAAAQIQRVMFELRRNVYYYLQRNVDERIRELRIDSAKWDAALEKVEARIFELLATVPELEGL
jgi:hypothetical protein